MEGIGNQACPHCGKTIETQHGFTPWCECGWNILAPTRVTAGPPSPRSRIAQAATRRLDRRVGEAIRRSDLRPRLAAAKAAAYGISIVVYLVAIGFVVGGLLLAVQTLSVLGIFFGLGLAALGFFMRPRFGKTPKTDIVTRSTAPTLHRLVDDVATALETPAIDILVIDDDYNASWRLCGVRRKRVLTLGLPLLAAHLRDSQRAEYLADALAARVAGSQAEIAMDEKMLFASVFETVALQAAREGGANLFEQLREYLQSAPERELERRRRVARLEGVRLSATHPPTARRLDLIESRPAEAGLVLLDEEHSTQIDEDCARCGSFSRHGLPRTTAPPCTLS